MQGDDEIQTRRQRDRHPLGAGQRRRARARARRSSPYVNAPRESSTAIMSGAPRALEPSIHAPRLARLTPTVNWTSAADYEDIRYELSGDGIAKITINRPEVRNAFRPETLIEVSDAFERAREDTTVGVIILTGEGPTAFCSGGDQRVRGDTGYVASGAASVAST